MHGIARMFSGIAGTPLFFACGIVVFQIFAEALPTSEGLSIKKSRKLAGRASEPSSAEDQGC